jgi:hypothetical protein
VKNVETIHAGAGSPSDENDVAADTLAHTPRQWPAGAQGLAHGRIAAKFRPVPRTSMPRSLSRGNMMA